MKKGLKLGLALAVAGIVKEGIAQTTQETNKDIQGVFEQTQDWKSDNKSNTYMTTASDFKEEETADSIDVTQSLKQITKYVDQLVKFYGKEGLNKKIHQIMKEHPNFGKLSEKQQKDILTKYFADFLKKEEDKNAMIGGFAGILTALLVISLHASNRRSKRGYYR